MKQKIILKIIAASLIFILSSIFITYPLILHLGDMVTGFGDELVIAWIQNWVIHALTSNPLSIFHTNILYPTHNTLAFSETFITTSILSMIPLALVKSPIVVTNFTFISSLALLGLSVWGLSFYLTRNFMASLLTGMLVIFSPAVLDKKVHLQVLSVYFVPLAIIFFIHFLKVKKVRFFYLFLLSFLLQIYNSFLPGYFILFVCATYLLWSFILKKSVVSILYNRKALFGIIVTGLFLLPLVIPYLQVSKEYGAKRDIRDTIHFALQPEDLMYPGEHTRLEEVLKDMSNQMRYPIGSSFKPGFLGFVFSMLALVSIISWLRSKKMLKKPATPFILTGFLGLILSFGPFLHLGRVTIHHPFPIPLPYAVLYYIAPGFQGFRNSARWEILFILCIAITIGILLTDFFKRFNKRAGQIVMLVLILGILAEYPFPMKFFAVKIPSQFPEIDQYLLRISDKNPVIYLPISSWNMAHPDEEIQREYFSTLHFTPMMNGYTGYTPPFWQAMVEKIDRDFPDPVTLKIIKDQGVRRIILDKRLLDLDAKNHKDKKGFAEMRDVLIKDDSLLLMKDLKEYSVFEYK